MANREQLRIEHAVADMGDVVIVADLAFSADRTTAVATVETDSNVTLDLSAGAFIRALEAQSPEQAEVIWQLIESAVQEQLGVALESGELMAQNQKNGVATQRSLNLHFSRPVHEVGIIEEEID